MFFMGENLLNATNILNKIKKHDPTFYHEENVYEYAVLLPLIEKNNKTHLLFEVRSLNLRSQPGDICFPGGGIEKKDINEKQTAIRETSEELGISQTKIHDVYPLDIMVPTPGKVIYPFVGRLEKDAQIHPNKDEVAEIFTIPLEYFLKTKPKTYNVSLKPVPADNFPYHLIVGGENYNWQTRDMRQYFYQYDDKVVWGLTAKIIQNFLSLITPAD